MADGASRDGLGPARTEGAQAKLHERAKPEQSDAQLQRGPGALERQRKIGEFTERSAVLIKEIAELEETVKSGVKVEPAGGAYDSANEECAGCMTQAFQELLEQKKSELQFINAQIENLLRQGTAAEAATA